MVSRFLFAALDIETGGFYFKDKIKHPIESIAIIATDSEYKETKRYTTFIQNEDNLEITEGAQRTHNIPLIELVNGKTIKQVYDDLVGFLKPLVIDKYHKVIIIGHNCIDFDLPFINDYIFKRFGDSIYNYINGYIFDILQISRIKYMNKEIEGGFKLEEMCTKMGLELSDGHSAINDTEKTLELAVLLMKEQQQEGILGESTQTEGCRGKFWI